MTIDVFHRVENLRVLKPARSVADLAGSNAIHAAQLAEAIQYRRPAA